MSKQKLRERLQKSIKWYQQKQSLHWREQLDTGMDIGELMWRTEIMMWDMNVRIFHNSFFFFKENSERMTRKETNDRFKRQKTETCIRKLALSSSEN